VGGSIAKSRDLKATSADVSKREVAYEYTQDKRLGGWGFQCSRNAGWYILLNDRLAEKVV
jgi:hypothetical protein